MKKVAGLIIFCMIPYLYASDFTPNGSAQFTQTFYGNAGGYKTETSHPSLALNYNFTSQLSATLQWDRAWNMYNYNGDEKQQNNNLSQPKLNVNYNYGQLGDTNIGWSTSFSLENQATFDGTNQYYALIQTAFDFSQYIPKNDYIQATQFAIAPLYVHGWTGKGTSGHQNTAALSLLTNWKLPQNFSFTFQAYAFRDWYDGSMQISNGDQSYSNANYFMMLAWLNYSNTLYQFNDSTSLGFNFIGGYDPYISSNRKGAWDPFLAGNQMYEWLSPTAMKGNYKSTYSLFALPQVNLTHNISKDFSVNAFVQVKYSNQVWGDSEKDWRLQPQAGIGINYNF
ncbi:FomA family porin-like outer membrane protein [Orbus mooreae]|uniref:FomA family porin-like outer membrane protein n=1 Tax=Orbus mooreae TaxID=3074107 RepID=UPI00370DCAEE